MPHPTVSLKYVRLDRDEPCSVCGASFNPSEDSGSRVLTIRNGEEPPFAALMCGGCHSKWSHGATVTFRQPVAL